MKMAQQMLHRSAFLMFFTEDPPLVVLGLQSNPDLTLKTPLTTSE